ncbi:hypothetical protein DM02DRAFT_656165 [Periconia macrospinosa]|uniref:Pentacotripeptide-repeat region of PRORP domain-containing protein n=1 Tax=Periconia macrospinosa TaxID=97972 RepID=A0A2V1DQV6_9PLEO|nr:hypothetical protein DM02DRAFT_656165 [Periconia macrospinosa]
MGNAQDVQQNTRRIITDINHGPWNVTHDGPWLSELTAFALPIEVSGQWRCKLPDVLKKKRTRVGTCIDTITGVQNGPHCPLLNSADADDQIVSPLIPSSAPLLRAMIRSYVCQQCRFHLRRSTTASRAPQLQSRATFISLRSTRPPPKSPDKHAPTQDTQDTQDARYKTDLNNENRGGKDDLDVIPPIRYEPSPESLRPGRYSHLRRQNGEPPTTHQNPQSAVPIDAETSATVSTSSTSPAHAQSINLFLNHQNVNSAWRLFIKEYASRDSPALTNPSPDDIPLLTDSIIFSRLLNSATLQFCNGMKLDVKPTDIIFRFEQMEIATPKMWSSAIGYATDQLLWMVSGGSRSKQTPEVLLAELVALWRLFFQCGGTATDPLESMYPDWRSIPDVKSLTKVQFDTRFGQRMQRYHPKVPTHPSLQFSAVTIFNLFDEVNKGLLEVPEELKEQTQPFIKFVTSILAGSNVQSILRHMDLSPALRNISSDFRAALIDQINSAPYQAMIKIGSQARPEKIPEETGTADRVLSKEEKIANLEDFYLRRIARAVVSQSNAEILQKLWEEIQGVYKKGNDITIPPTIYDAFLSGFMQLFQPDKTTEVWNFMVTHGTKPGVRTWVAMLDGCVKARDLDGLNGIWDRMIRSGVEPDNYAWVTRIYGLITLRQINNGFMAMDEMGKMWIAAQNATQTGMQNPSVKGNSHKRTPAKVSSKAANKSGAIKPTVEVINGAIQALTSIPELRHDRKVAYAQKILQWSTTFSITPNVITYNTLVRMYLRGNDHVTAFELLKQMSKQGIHGDMATHTMLLSAAFNNEKFGDLSESEQANRIIEIFDDIEADGLELNAHICSSAIDRLLKLYGNVSAVMVILNHMASRDISISAQINTSIITHCFQQTPPDIASVDAIVARLFGPGALPTDKYLCDRILEGYAANLEVEKMMEVLKNMSRHGKLPSWDALTAVVRALGETGQWDTAREVVRDVQMGEGIAKGGMTGSQKYRSIFFGVVKSLGHGLTDSLAGDFWRDPAAQEGDFTPDAQQVHGQQGM